MDLRDLASVFPDPAADDDPTALPIMEALTRLASGGVIIDVRTEAEYEAAHIPGARYVTITALRENPVEAIYGADPLAMMDPDTPTKTVIVVSSTPQHASAVAHLLRETGLPEAYPLKGGLIAWMRDGQILIPGKPQPR